MSGNEIVNTVLKVAEKVAAVDLEQAGKTAAEAVKNFNGATIANAMGNTTVSEKISTGTNTAVATMDVIILVSIRSLLRIHAAKATLSRFEIFYDLIHIIRLEIGP